MQSCLPKTTLCEDADEKFDSMEDSWRSLRSNQSRRRRQLQGRQVGAMLNDSTACELQCLNGGVCRWVSTDRAAIKSLILLGKPMQECLCQPGYGGAGCEIHVDMCPELPNADACACSMASQISPLASETYCSTTSEQGADYCVSGSDADPIQQVLNGTTSIEDVVFCVNGGRCINSVLRGSVEQSSNMFASTADPCLCPVDFAGPHCEFLKKYASLLNSTSNGADSNGSATNTIDDTFKGTLIPNDDAPTNDTQSTPSNPPVDHSTLWSVLACLGGVATVAACFVLYRKWMRRQGEDVCPPFNSKRIQRSGRRKVSHLINRKWQLKPDTRMAMVNSSRVVVSMEKSIVTTQPLPRMGASTSVHEQFRCWWRRVRSTRAHPPPTMAHPPPMPIPPVAATTMEAVECHGDLTESGESTQSSSQHPGVHAAGDHEEGAFDAAADVDEILIGTFDNYSLYRGYISARETAGNSICTNERGSDTSTRIDMQPPPISRLPATSAFVRFPVAAMPASSRMDEYSVVLGSANDQASLRSAYSSSSYYSSESSTSIFMGPTAGYVVRSRESVLYSPDSLYTSTSDNLKFPPAGAAVVSASASFSDYSSFPDSVTDGNSTFDPDTTETRSSDESDDNDDGSHSGITMDWSEQLHFAGRGAI